MKRIDSLQVLRGIGFLLIFAYHNLLIDGVFSRFGVALFFVMSGFLNIVHGYNSSIKYSDSIRYALKKIKKVFALHTLSVLFAFVLYLYSFRNALLENIRRNALICIARLFTNIVLISDWIPRVGVLGEIAEEYNIVTWFLSALFLFYIFTPFVICIMKRIYGENKTWRVYVSFLCTIIIALLFNVVYIHIYGGILNAIYGIYHSPVLRIFDYLFGTQVGYIYILQDDKRYKEVEAINSKLLLFLVAVSIWILLLIIYGIGKIGTKEEMFVSNTLYFSIPISILILLLSIWDSKNENALNIRTLKIGRVFIWLGDISKKAFLIHVPVLNLVHAIYRRMGNVNTYLWFVISFSVTTLLTVLYDKSINWKCIQAK